MPTDVYTSEAIIPGGAAVSQAIPFTEYHTISLWLPAAWTTAALTMQASRLGGQPTAEGDWKSVYTDSAELVLAAGPNRVLTVPAGILAPAGTRWIRLVSGVEALRVNQTANRIIHTIFRRF
jgi:hypothetical protein